MIGLISALLAAASAELVARRDRRHRPIALNLIVALSYAVCSAAGSDVAAPRLMLILWALVAMTASWAYLDAWRVGSWLAPLGFIAALVAPALMFGDTWHWTLATWGALGISATTGGLAAWWSWLYSDAHRPLTITQRVAIVLTASDVAALLFVPWPRVQVWQGITSAVVVAGMQGAWYWTHRKDS